MNTSIIVAQKIRLANDVLGSAEVMASEGIHTAGWALTRQYQKRDEVTNYMKTVLFMDWVQGKISLSTLLFKLKVQNMLVLYMQGQKRNWGTRIIKLKEPWTVFNFKVIQSIFHPDQLHGRCHFLKEVAEYLSKRLNNVKDKYHNHGEDDIYTDNYNPVDLVLGWSK